MSKRPPLDLTDRELYYVALCIQSHINDRNRWTSKGGAMVFRNLFNKIATNGFERKDPKSILHPIINFDEDED